MALSPFSATWRNDILKYLTSVVVGPASSTNNAAARFDGTTGKLIKNSALLIASSTGALSRSGNGGIPVQGTNTNDNAAAGDVGEYISAAKLAAASVALTSNTQTDVLSISLSPGDWDVWAQIAFDTASTTDFTILSGGASRTSATLGAAGDDTQGRATVIRSAGVIGVNPDPVLAVPISRMSLASTTTVYLVGFATFTAGTVSAYGYIGARRAR